MTRVEKLAAAYEEERQQMVDEGDTNKFTLLLMPGAVLKALETTFGTPENNAWQERNRRISETKYSRRRDRYRQLRRSDFQFAAALDAR